METAAAQHSRRRGALRSSPPHPVACTAPHPPTLHQRACARAARRIQCAHVPVHSGVLPHHRPGLSLGKPGSREGPCPPHSQGPRGPPRGGQFSLSAPARLRSHREGPGQPPPWLLSEDSSWHNGPAFHTTPSIGESPGQTASTRRLPCRQTRALPGRHLHRADACALGHVHLAPRPWKRGQAFRPPAPPPPVGLAPNSGVSGGSLLPISPTLPRMGAGRRHRDVRRLQAQPVTKDAAQPLHSMPGCSHSN